MNAFFDLLILLASLQGIVLSIILRTLKNNRLAGALLSPLLFLIATAGIGLVAGGNGLYQVDWIKRTSLYMPFIIVMPVGPLIYFYVKSFTERDFAWDWKHFYHFLPVVFDFVPALLMIGFRLAILDNDHDQLSAFLDQYNTYIDLLRWFSVTTYLIFTYKHIGDLKFRVNYRGKSYQWLMLFIRAFLVFQAIWLLFLIPYLIPYYSNLMLDTLGWYPIYLPLAALIYLLSLKGYEMGIVDFDLEIRVPASLLKMPSQVAEELHIRLIKCMEQDQLFLDPDLSLDLLAKYLGTRPKVLSALLNSQLQVGFNEFLNQYRIMAVQEELNKQDKSLSLLGLALKCGFNSQPTFQRAFKQFTGKTPTTYLLELKNRQ